MDLVEILISQYLASLQMLEQTIAACPETLWAAAGDKNRFCNVAYHALFFTHYYLADSEDAFTPWYKHRDGYDDVEWSQTAEPYERGAVLEYLAFCRQQVRERVPRLDLEAPAGFHKGKRTGLELQIYSIRHIMQHTGELMDRLAGKAEEIDWVGSVHA